MFEALKRVLGKPRVEAGVLCLNNSKEPGRSGTTQASTPKKESEPKLT